MIQTYALTGLLSLAAGFGGGFWLCHTMTEADRADAADDRAEALEARMDANLALMLAESRQAVTDRVERKARQQEIRLTLRDRETRIEHVIAESPSPPECVLPEPWLPILAQGERAATAALDRLR